VGKSGTNQMKPTKDKHPETTDVAVHPICQAVGSVWGPSHDRFDGTYVCMYMLVF
jgi:hypothetical protein